MKLIETVYAFGSINFNEPGASAGWSQLFYALHAVSIAGVCFVAGLAFLVAGSAYENKKVPLIGISRKTFGFSLIVLGILSLISIPLFIPVYNLFN